MRSLTTNVLVTGANTGIGRVTAEALARGGAHVVLACRSREKTQPVLDGIAAGGGSAEMVQLDLGDLESVRACATELVVRGKPFDVLVNNAGLAGLRGVTKQGFEITFGTNHLGPFLLTTMLLPLLQSGKAARIVNVSSRAHLSARAVDWGALRKPTASTTGVPEYNVSKLCNILFTKELARGRAGEGVHSYALHPGVIASDAWRQVPWPFRPLMKLFMKTTEEGAKTSLYCATSPDVEADDGLYYDACKAAAINPLGDDAQLARELWEKSEEWTRA
jgi:NAD(P)-dependent dehydrogenase (short-subunit alcohol dehydrogenase family)